MRNIGLIVNLDRDIGGKYLAEVASWLSAKGLCPIITKNLEMFVNTDCRVTDEDKLYRQSDFIITLGGDGTILGASRFASKYDTPLMGINLGTLGFLTDAEERGGIEAISKVLEGKFNTEKRMMLEAEILSDDFTHTVKSGLIALNDVCVLRGSAPKVKTFSLNINNQFLDSYKADGIIIVTPTGSTAYNISAGGPVLKPDIEIIAITPVCPHKMHSRPMVVSAEDVISVEIEDNCEHEAVLTFDGQDHIVLEPGQAVRVKKSPNYVTLIKTNNLGFYDILRAKLH